MVVRGNSVSAANYLGLLSAVRSTLTGLRLFRAEAKLQTPKRVKKKVAPGESRKERSAAPLPRLRIQKWNPFSLSEEEMPRHRSGVACR